MDKWEEMHRDNSLLPVEERIEIPRLEQMTFHNWQAAALGALHEAAEANLLSK